MSTFAMRLTTFNVTVVASALYCWIPNQPMHSTVTRERQSTGIASYGRTVKFSSLATCC